MIEYNEQYRFITLDLGARDGLQKGALLRVLRDGKTIGTAQVRQLREGACAALVLPGTQAKIQVGDQIALV